MVFGSNNCKVIPTSISFRMAFMLIIDTIVRAATSAEIPVSILTTVAGVLCFIIILKNAGRQLKMIFKVEKGCFGYHHSKNILSDIYFSVKDGEILSVLASNRVGKITLLRCMMVRLGRSAHISILNQPNKEDIEISKKAMKAVGIQYLGGKYCNQISGDELQMVLIARELCA